MKTNLVLILLIVVASGGQARITAQAVGSADILRASVTVDAIDPVNRTITFRDASGRKDTMAAPAEMKRFDEIKVGDKLNLTYTYARVYELRKATTSDAVATTGTSGRGTSGATGTSGSVTRTDGPLPGALATNRMTKTVTVIATDLAEGLLTVRTPEGRIVKSRVQDKSLMTDVVADDKIEITYAESLLAEFERP